MNFSFKYTWVTYLVPFVSFLCLMRYLYIKQFDNLNLVYPMKRVFSEYGNTRVVPNYNSNDQQKAVYWVTYQPSARFQIYKIRTWLRLKSGPLGDFFGNIFRIDGNVRVVAIVGFIKKIRVTEIPELLRLGHSVV